MCYFFFFQAEDGIRDKLVTGVQTCALPISYRLSPEGEAIFPKRYEETLTELLERVARKDGRGAVGELFADHYAALARRLAAQLEDTPPAERVAAVARLMSDAGDMAGWEPGARSGAVLGAG